jgi:hypothetical protein
MSIHGTVSLDVSPQELQQSSPFVSESGLRHAALVPRSDAVTLCAGIVAEGDEALSWVKDRAKRYIAENGLETRQSQALVSIDYLVSKYGQAVNETRLQAALRAVSRGTIEVPDEAPVSREEPCSPMHALTVRTPLCDGGLVYWVREEEQRQGLIDQGIDPGLIYTRAELHRLVEVSRLGGDIQPLVDAKKMFDGKIQSLENN